MALKNSSEEEVNALLWEVNNGKIDTYKTEEGLLWRGQAVQHDEPKGNRIRGWSERLETALEFARSGPEVRKRDGTGIRKTSVAGAVDGLDPGDKAIISLYEITGGKGVEIKDLLEQAEMAREAGYEEMRSKIGNENQAEIIREFITSPKGYDVSLPDLDDFEIVYLAERLGIEVPPEGPEREDWILSAQSGSSRAKEIADALVQMFQADGMGAVEEILHDTNADLDGAYNTAERRWIRTEMEARASATGDYSLADPVVNEYEDEAEFIMDGGSLEGYRRIDILLATGDEGPIPTKDGVKYEDNAETWLRAKVREALEDGGYKPEQKVSDEQLTLEQDTLASSLDQDFVPADPDEDTLYDSEGLMRPTAVIAAVLQQDDPNNTEFDGFASHAWNNYYGGGVGPLKAIKNASREDMEQTLSKLQEIRAKAGEGPAGDETLNMREALQRAIDVLSESMDDYFGKPDTKDTETALVATGMASPAVIEPKRAYEGDLFAQLGQHMAYRFDETTFGSAFSGTLEKDLPDIDEAAGKLGWPQELIAAAKKMRQNALDKRMELVEKANRGFGKSMAQAVAAQPLQNFYESPEGAMASPVGPRLRSDEAMLSEVASGMSLDALKDGQGPVENFLRGALNGIGIDPYDIDMDKLTSHADDAEHAPISRLVVGGRGVSPCGLSRRVDFAVHVLLPELLVERYPRVAETLRRTSPRWGWRTGELPTGIGRPTDRELQTERARAELGDAMRSPATYQPAQKHDELVDTGIQAWVGSAKAKPEYQDALDALAWEIENNGESFDGQVLFRGQSRFLPAPSESGYRGWSADPGQGLHFGTHGYSDGSATVTVYVTQNGKGIDVAKRVEAMDKEKSPMNPTTRSIALMEKEIILSPDSIDEQRIVIEVSAEERGKPGYRDRMIRKIQEEAGVMDDVLAADKARFEQAMASPVYRRERTKFKQAVESMKSPNQTPKMNISEQELTDRVVDIAVQYQSGSFYDVASVTAAKVGDTDVLVRPFYNNRDWGSPNAKITVDGHDEAPNLAAEKVADILGVPVASVATRLVGNEESLAALKKVDEGNQQRLADNPTNPRTRNVVVDVGGERGYLQEIDWDNNLATFRSLEGQQEREISLDQVRIPELIQQELKVNGERLPTVAGSGVLDLQEDETRNSPAFQNLAILDDIIGNTDRHMGNLLVHKQYETIPNTVFYAIDHDLSFGSGERYEKIRERELGYTDGTGATLVQSLPATLSDSQREAVTRIATDTDFHDELKNIIPVDSPSREVWNQRVDEMVQRAQRLLGTGSMASPVEMASPMASPNIFNLLKGNKGKEDDLGRSMLEAPPEPVEGIPEYTDVELQDIKGAGGSNDARIAEDPDGNKWLVKAYRGDSDRVATELLANAIYRDLGVTVSNAGVGISRHPTYGDQIAVTYPLVDGEQRRWSEPNADLAEGFVADALLANWDVIGLTQDNILWNGDQPVRLDQGGTLEFRAQGERKSFGSVPTELWTMQSGRGQANGRMEITEAGMQAGAKDAALRLTPERIDELVDAAPFKDEAMRERIRTSLKERVAWLERFSRGEEGIPEPLQGDEITDYFEQREFPSLPEEDLAMEAYLGDDRTAIDDHLRSGAPKEEATEEIADTIATLDELFRSPMSKTDEDMTAWAVLPEPLENPEDLEGEWMADKSYLPLQTDFAPTPGVVAVKVQIPAGSSVVMPAAEGLDAPDGALLMGRNTKLQIQAVLQENGAVILQAVSVPR